MIALKLIRVRRKNIKCFTPEFVKGFETGARRQLEADKAAMPRGRWLDRNGEPTNYRYSVYCSNCGDWSEYASTYCKSCGAYMKGRAQDG